MTTVLDVLVLIRYIPGTEKGMLRMRFSEAMDGMIKVRVSHDEKRALKEAARQRGLTLSEMLRVSATEATARAAA